jgi:hypothetical protein
MDAHEKFPQATPLRRILLPTEHGGWAFLMEPILLGLLVAFSRAGLAISLAAVAAFLARQPLRLFMLDRAHGRRHARTALAERVFAACVLVGALALAAAGLLAQRAFLLPLGLAAPLAALSVALDLARRSRAAAAEVGGAVALGAVAAAIAVAGGWRLGPALGLWGILAARALPTVLYVRARVRLDRAEAPGVALPLAAHLIAIAAIALLALRALAPWAAVGALGMLAVRCAFGLSPVRPVMSTRRLGVSELVFGLMTVFAAAWGVARGV